MKTGKLAKLGFLYTISSLLVQGLQMALVPIYTRSLNPEEFGQLQMINTVQAILAIFITLGMNSGLARFYKEHEDGNRLKNIALTGSLIWSLLFVAVIRLLSKPLAAVIFHGSPDGEAYLINTCLVAAFTALATVYSVHYSMQYKVGMFSAIQMSRALLLVLVTAYYMFAKKAGVVGALHAQVWANGIVLAGCFLLDIRRLRFLWGKREFTTMIKYGTGLMPGGLSNWVYTLIDRYFIQYMIGLRSVGVYSMGYRVGMLMEPLFLNPFKSVFTSYKYEIYKHQDGKEKILNMYKYYNFIGWFFLSSIAIGAELAIRILATPDYIDAMYVVPLVAFSYYLAGLSEFYALGIHIANKPIYESVNLTVCAGVNVVLNLALIPYLGMMGAAYATVFSYAVLNVLDYRRGRLYYPLPLSYLSPFKYLAAFVPIYGTYLILSPLTGSFLLKLILDVVLIALFPVLAVIFRLVPASMVTQIARLVYSKLRRGGSKELIA